MTTADPKLELCSLCGGSGYFDDHVCPVCAGGRFAPVAGDLGESRTHKTRPFLWNPGTRTLYLWRGKVQSHYRVREFVPDPVLGERPSRAWELVKDDGAVYHVRTGGAWHACDCKGFESGVSAKANARAAAAGYRQVLGFGCSHVDAVLHLLFCGLLDAKKEGE